MKNLLLTLVVALFATSFAFSSTSGSGTGTVSVEVKWPNVTVAAIESPATGQIIAPAGFIGLQKFVFQATHAAGIGVNVTNVVWGGTDVTKVKATHHSDANLNPVAPWISYNSPTYPVLGSTLTNFTADFGIWCAPGVAQGNYDVTCTITCDY